MEQLREPLNLIRNFAHILQEHHAVLEPGELAEAIAAIEEQVEVALHSLDDEAAAKEGGSVESARYGLSRREMEVLGFVAQGRADKQIASELGISTYTVNKHVGGILLKMGAASRTEAGVRAVQERLV